MEKRNDTINPWKKKKLLYRTRKCHICKETFYTDKDDKNYINERKVKDHCHYTGKFTGASHSKCNLNYKVPKDIQVIIHNATYDTHFIINQLAIELKGKWIALEIIWKNICVFLYQLRNNMIMVK